ncbi:MAG: IS256 family transposase [Mycobacteriaceae bacterium]
MGALARSIDKSAVKPGDAERTAIREMVKSAKERGLDITGPDGLLKLLTKTVLETALEEEMTEHLGYDKHDPTGRDGGNSRNGTRAKTVISEAAGEVRIDVPRDRDGSFTPVIVKKRQCRLGDVDKIVLSLYGKGMTTGEISAHFAEIYGVSVSNQVVSTITDKVIQEQQSWSSRPLAWHYAAVFVDAIHVKVRDGAVANRPFYAAIGVDLQGHRDVLGIWAGTPGAGESSKFWISILTELKNRGVANIFYLVCDGLKGMPQSVNTVFPDTIVQTCVVHLIRNTFKYSSKRYWAEIARDLKPVYTAVNADAALAAFESFDEKWSGKYPAIGKLWRAAWDNFVPFLDLDIEVRHLLSSTNAIESLNARFRKVIDARGHFPNEQAAMKALYLAVRSLDPKGTGQQRWITRWKPILNVLAVSFHDRMPETANL